MKTLFTIPIGGGIKIQESLVVMWIAMAVIIVFMLLATRKLSVENPGKGQLALEWAHEKFKGFFGRLVGPNAKGYVPYFMFLVMFIAVMNLLPLFGFAQPTKDLNITVGMALMSIFLVEFANIRARGFGGFLKSFKHPTMMMLPFNILDIFIRLFSLSMRLFGNMLGGFVIMELIHIAVPVVVPAIAGLYFDIFDGLLQAFIFAFLTSLYIGEATEDLEAE